MVVIKKEFEPKDDVPKTEKPTRAVGRPKKAEGSKAFAYEGEEALIVLSVGGTNYDFRKGSPVYLPPGQSPNHPNVHEVEA